MDPNGLRGFQGLWLCALCAPGGNLARASTGRPHSPIERLRRTISGSSATRIGTTSAIRSSSS